MANESSPTEPVVLPVDPIVLKPIPSPELGFGAATSQTKQRLVNPDGTFNVRRRGVRKLTLADAYHLLITLSWTKFFLIVLGGFMTLNFIFAFIYYFLGIQHLTGLIGTTPFDLYSECFFFSSQTLTTLGYGRIAPTGFWTSAVAGVESMLGLLVFALSTSLLWGRFSRPTAKIFYSHNALVAPYRGGRGLMFRTVNGGSSQLSEIETTVTLARNETEGEKELKKFYRLKLELDRLNFMPTSWTIVHPIDESSPLFGLSQQEINDADTEILAMIKAFDESYSQIVYSRSSYKFNEIVAGAKFLTMMDEDYDGVAVVDLDKLNAYETIGLPPETVKTSEQLPLPMT